MPTNTADYQANYLKEKNVKVRCELCACEFLKYNKPLHERSVKHTKKLKEKTDKAMQKNNVIQLFELMKKKIKDQDEQLKQLSGTD